LARGAKRRREPGGTDETHHPKKAIRIPAHQGRG
jgi:hypothetical protein